MGLLLRSSRPVLLLSSQKKLHMMLLMKNRAHFTCMILLVLMVWAPTAFAKKVAGVTLDENITIEDTELTLNGAGIRKKLFIKLYVGSLYLQQSRTDAAEIMAADEPMMIRLNMRSDLLTRKKLVKALNTGFKNSAGDNLAAIQPRIDELLALVSEPVRPGDQLSLLYLPETGTSVIKNGELLGQISGLDFKQAFFGVWLSAKPAQASLKQAMIKGF